MRNKGLSDVNSTSEGWRDRVLIGTFAAIALLAGVDVLGDLRAGVSGWHVAAELAVVAVSVGAVAALVRGLLVRAQDLDRRLSTSAASAAAWRDEAETLLKGLGASIDRQFGRWRLTPAEKEVALLLLKGLAHKDIARMRAISEATARQQARAVYRKADVAGRNDLAAFFLEDLALPRDDQTVL
jgi:DNA-binding NarL/FixJ family response regulator